MKPASRPDPLKPLTGSVFRLLAAEQWRDFRTPEMLRELGGKVVYRDTLTTTHLVTVMDPPPVGGHRGSMSFQEFAEYVHAVSRLADAGKPFRVLGLNALLADVAQARRGMREHQALQKESAYERALAALDPTPSASSFVGI